MTLLQATTLLEKPAFYAHLLSGLFLALSAYLLLTHLSVLRRLSLLPALLLSLLASIALAQHAQSHAQLEQLYGYDPLAALQGR